MKSDDVQNSQALQKCIAFINDIGIKTVLRQVGSDSFLPGLSIDKGCIIIDEDALKYPGDILHEAGHIAVVPANERSTLDATSIAGRPNREAEEMMAIAWSYAACVHLGIDAGFVFHDQGYKGGGSSLADNFKNGHYFGVPMLQWVGMAIERKNAAMPDEPVYPVLLQWLRR